ncbi:hypothetical protein WA026_015945 [Henosepilachna vigintioctopunctata]|uniref:Uncharacterized protein n=1 Tax=Henosepilachna vigintioctopunctata TaxID=420089 RepID=A0AAW1U8F4_9CUCU
MSSRNNECKISKNNKVGSSKSKRPSTSSVQGPARKTFRAGDPSFEQEVCDLLLASDQSDNEENTEHFFVLQSELIRNHEIDDDEGPGSGSRPEPRRRIG